MVDPQGRALRAHRPARGAGRSTCRAPAAGQEGAGRVRGQRRLAGGQQTLLGGGGAARRSSQNVFAYLVAGFALDDVLALEVQAGHRHRGGLPHRHRVGGRGGRLHSRSGAAGPAARRAAQCRAICSARVTQRGEAVDQLEIELEGGRWVALLAPLKDASGAPVGASRRARLARQRARRLHPDPQHPARARALARSPPRGHLLRALAARLQAGAQAGRRRPTAARQGNYDPMPTGGSREVAELATAFNDLLTDLRERRDMAGLRDRSCRAACRSRRRAAGAAAAGGARPGCSSPSSCAAYAARGECSSRSRRSARLSATCSGSLTAVGARGGRLETVAGHRVLASLRRRQRPDRGARGGVRDPHRARGVATPRSSRPSRRRIAIASGEALSGAVTFADERRARPDRAAGPADRGADARGEPGRHPARARRSTPISTTSCEQAGVELGAQRSLLSTQPIYILAAEHAARIAGRSTLGRG